MCRDGQIRGSCTRLLMLMKVLKMLKVLNFSGAGLRGIFELAFRRGQEANTGQLLNSRLPAVQLRGCWLDKVWRPTVQAVFPGFVSAPISSPAPTYASR